MTRLFENISDRSQGLGQETALPVTPAGAELWIGPYRSGKTRRLIDELIKFCKQNPFSPAIVVVPSARYRALFEALLHDRLKELGKSESQLAGIAGIVGLKVVPFYKVCELVLRKSSVPFRIIPEQARAALISDIVAELRQNDKLTSLQAIINFAGTHAALLELIDELQRAALLPAELIAKLEQTAQCESRHLELARIYESYCATLSKLGYVDERGAAFQARALLSSEASSWSTGMIAADGFDRFNALQLQVLEGLARRSEHARILFDYIDPGVDLDGEYSWKATSFAELTSIFHDARVQRLGQSKRAQAVQLRHKLLDPFFEVSEAARIIKGRIADGANPSDFLVVARSIAPYSAAIRAAFEDAGINFFLDESVKLISLPIIQFIMRLVELSAIRRFRRLDVLTCFRSVNFRLAAVCGSDKELQLLDRYSLEQMVVETGGHWLELLKAKSEKLPQALPAAFTGFLQDLTPPAIGSVRTFVAWIEDILDRYLQISLGPGDDGFLRWEEQKAIAEFRRCLAGLIHEETICGARESSPEYFLGRLRMIIERSNFRRLPRNNDYVTVCGADLAPNRTYEDVFILGLSEGQFPRHARQSGFLSADEVASWLSFGVDIRNPRFHAAFEPALFRSLIQRARKHAYLSCPSFNVSGEELIPSYLLTGGDESQIKHCAPFSKSLALPISARDALSAAVWHDSHKDICDLKTMLPLTTLIESLTEPVTVARSRAYLGAFGEYNGDFRDLVQLKGLTLHTPLQWSASKLNQYGKCPFSYWVSNVVRAEPVEEPAAGLDAMILGNTYHKAMELFYRTLLAQNLNLATMDEQEAARIFEGAINVALLQLSQNPEVRHGEFWQYEKNEITFRLKRFFQKELQRAQGDQDMFVPVMTEASFGLPGLPDERTFPPLKIPFGSRELQIRGRIDRVDVAQGTAGDHPRVRIVDYKAGSSPISKDDAISGRNIQLPLYALAVQNSIMPGSKVTKGLYLSVSSGEPSGRLSFEPAAGEPDLLETVTRHVQDFVAGIESGDFAVRPNNRSVCKRCPHRPICRVSELPDLNKAE